MRTLEEIYLDVIVGNYEASNYKLLEYDLWEIKEMIEGFVDEIENQQEEISSMWDEYDEFCKNAAMGHYLCDPLPNFDNLYHQTLTPCERYENYPLEDIQDEILDMYDSLKRFKKDNK